MVFKIKNHHVEILLRLFILFCANAATFFSEVDARLTGFIHEIKNKNGFALCKLKVSFKDLFYDTHVEEKCPETPFPAPLSLIAM